MPAVAESEFTTQVLASPAELRGMAAEWDDLWDRAEVTTPCARAETVAQWVEHFSPAARFQAIVVQRSGRLVAALPLVAARLKRVLRVGGLPVSPWSACGDLLLDPQADLARAAAALAPQLGRLAWPLLCLENVAFERPSWQALIEACRQRGLLVHSRARMQLGQITIDGDWQAYQARWSKSHRRNLRRAQSRAAARGRVELRVIVPPVEQVEPLLRRAFAVEDRGWKSRAQSSVLKHPQVLDFYLRQARMLAEWGQLVVIFLELDHRPMAFELGTLAKGVYVAHKVGYDEEFSDCVPGQLLRHELYARWFAEPSCRLVDFAGPSTEATARWSTHEECRGRVLVASSHWTGRLLFRTLCTAHDYLDLWRSLGSGSAPADNEPPRRGTSRAR